MKRNLVLAAALLLVAGWSGLAGADVPVPHPETVFSRGEEPTGNTIIAAGAALSAVVIAVGLIAARWPVKTAVGRVTIASVTGLVLVGVWWKAGGILAQAERDRSLWKQWDIDEANRRSHWRGPPEPGPFDPPPPSAAPPDSPEPAPPTAAADSVQ